MLGVLTILFSRLSLLPSAVLMQVCTMWEVRLLLLRLAARLAKLDFLLTSVCQVITIASHCILTDSSANRLMPKLENIDYESERKDNNKQTKSNKTKNNLISQKSNKSKKKECQECDTVFYFNLDFQKHQKKLHSSIKCSNCGEQFESLFLLSKHKNKEHMPKPGFGLNKLGEESSKKACPQCGKEISRSFLKIHQQSVHGNVRYDCFICGKRFTTKRSKHIHMTRCSLGEQTEPPPPIPRDVSTCQFCGKDFKTVENYRKNFRAHLVHCKSQRTKTKPHQCPTCVKTYYEKRDVIRHVEKSHPEDYEDFVKGSSISTDDHLTQIHCSAAHVDVRSPGFVPSLL